MTSNFYTIRLRTFMSRVCVMLIFQYSTVLPRTVLCYAVTYCTVLCCDELYCTVLQRTVLRYAVTYCTALQRTILYVYTLKTVSFTRLSIYFFSPKHLFPDCQHVYPSVRPSICPSVCLSICYNRVRIVQ